MESNRATLCRLVSFAGPKLIDYLRGVTTESILLFWSRALLRTPIWMNRNWRVFWGWICRFWRHKIIAGKMWMCVYTERRLDGRISHRMIELDSTGRQIQSKSDGRAESVPVFWRRSWKLHFHSGNKWSWGHQWRPIANRSWCCCWL